MTEHEEATRVVVRIVDDPDPDLSWLEQDCFNEPTDTEEEGYGRRRIEEHGRSWWMVGVTVDAFCQHGGVIDNESLWSIESDASGDHFATITLDLLDQLRERVLFADDAVTFVEES